MKYHLAGIILSICTIAIADDEVKYTQSDKLNISGVLKDQNPENWLREYGAMKPKKEKLVRITAEFNIENVRALIITDMNAINNKCGPQQLEDLLYLSFDPVKNINRITTRIHKPCFDGRNANLRLRVVTNSNKRYYNIITLTAHPAAFQSWSN